MNSDRLPFVSRDSEQQNCLSILENSQNNSQVLHISGISGAGKSYFIKHVLHKIWESHPEDVIIYFDLNSDDFTTTLLFESLIYRCWNNDTFAFNRATSIPEDYDFEKFLKKSNLKKKSVKHLLQIISSSIELIPGYGNSLKSVIPKDVLGRHELDPTPGVAFIFFEYLKFIVKNRKIYLTIDNYQFLPKSIKELLESHMDEINVGLNFIVIERLESIDSKKLNINCFNTYQASQELSVFNKQQLKTLAEKYLKINGKDLQVIATDCFYKTGGNLKEIEYYLVSYKKNISSGDKFTVKNLLETMDSLPLLYRNLLTITALFPAGLKVNYVSRIISRLILSEDQDEINLMIQELITIGYLVINSESGEILKPAHEKIITSIKSIQTEEEFIEVHQSLIIAFEELFKSPIGRNEYNYLLHCFVGILNTQQLASKIEYVIELVDLQHKRNLFYYLVSIYREFPDMIDYLPNFSIQQILDSFQKTSEFHLGLAALRRLDKLGGSSSMLKLTEAKYLTQMYRFEDALRILEKMDHSDPSVMLYYINVLEHLCEDKKVKKILNNFFEDDNQSEEYYILLRNTAHYFSFKQANINLLEALNYFHSKNHVFVEATIYNNLSVIYIWNNMPEKGLKYATKAKNILESIDSNELFEPLCNLGVIKVVTGYYSEAIEYFEKSKRVVPRSLLLDHIILNNNILITRLLQDSVSTEIVHKELLSLFSECKQINDPWLRFQIVYNLHAIESFLEIPITEPPSKYFLKKNSKRKETTMEIFIDSQLSSKQIRLLLSLSPNWRY